MDSLPGQYSLTTNSVHGGKGPQEMPSHAFKQRLQGPLTAMVPAVTLCEGAPDSQEMVLPGCHQAAISINGLLFFFFKSPFKFQEHSRDCQEIKIVQKPWVWELLLLNTEKQRQTDRSEQKPMSPRWPSVTS